MTDVLNKKNPTFLEILQQADKSDAPVDFLKKCLAEDQRVSAILGYALNPKFKMPLPEGTPPYIPSESPLGLAEIELLHLSNKLYVMFNKETNKARKEQMFIQWVEKMNAQEAELLIAIKDQTLHTLYPNLTEDVFVDALGWDRQLLAQIRKSIASV